MTPDEQRQLVRQWQQGDDAAKEKLISYLYPIIVEVLRRYASSPRLQCHDVEDIIQETFVIACEKVKSKEFDSGKPGSFTAYCVGIGLNRIRHTLSKTKPFVCVNNLRQYLYKKDSDSLDIVIQTELLENLHKVMLQIDPQEYDVVCLFFGLLRQGELPEKLKLKEIDERFGHGHGWAGRKLTRALKKLSKCLGSQ